MIHDAYIALIIVPVGTWNSKAMDNDSHLAVCIKRSEEKRQQDKLSSMSQLQYKVLVFVSSQGSDAGFTSLGVFSLGKEIFCVSHRMFDRMLEGVFGIPQNF